EAPPRDRSRRRTGRDARKRLGRSPAALLSPHATRAPRAHHRGARDGDGAASREDQAGDLMDHDQPPADAIERAWRWLVRAHPRAFRARFETEVTEFFHTRRTAARAAGLVASARYLAGAFFDLARSVARERRRSSPAADQRQVAIRSDVRSAVRRL